MMETPNEGMHFLLAWFYVIVLERLQYTRLGWSKHNDFNESNPWVARDTLDTWKESAIMA